MPQSEYEVVYEKFKDMVKEESSKRGYGPHSKVVSDAFNLVDQLGRDNGFFNEEYRKSSAKLVVGHFAAVHENRTDSDAVRRELIEYVRDCANIMLNDE